MKATTPKPRKKSTVSAKKNAKIGSIVSSTLTGKKATNIGGFLGSVVTGKKKTSMGSTIAANTLGKRKEPAWVRQEVKGLMDALSGR